METKERILIAAQELFFRYGIKSITMDDIAKHLGMSKKTIYQFFKDKNEIVISLCQLSFEENKCKMCEMAETSENAVDEIMKIMEHVGQMFSKMNPNLFYDMQKFHPDAWKQFLEFKEKNITWMVEANIEKGIKQGLYRKEVDAKILAKFRIGQIEMALNPDIFPTDEFNLTKVQVDLLDHFLHGILSMKGHKLINKYKQVSEEE